MSDILYLNQIKEEREVRSKGYTHNVFSRANRFLELKNKAKEAIDRMAQLDQVEMLLEVEKLLKPYRRLK